MRHFIPLIILFFVATSIKAQKAGKREKLRIEKDTFILKQDVRIAAISQTYTFYGDTELMALHNHKDNYFFKRGLFSGLYVATFDKKIDWDIPIKDTAMIVTIKNGAYNGLLKRWNKDNKRIAEECEYKDGLMNGVRKLYYYDKDGKQYKNIEIYNNGIPVKVIQMEW